MPSNIPICRPFREARRVPEAIPAVIRRCSVVLVQATQIPDFRGFLLYRSPLADSNRRPPPYHRRPKREARARAGLGGHENPANRGNRPTPSDRVWTRVVGLAFPWCSVAVLPTLMTAARASRMGG
jgi:hypothetical protein